MSKNNPERGLGTTNNVENEKSKGKKQEEKTKVGKSQRKWMDGRVSFPFARLNPQRPHKTHPTLIQDWPSLPYPGKTAIIHPMPSSGLCYIQRIQYSTMSEAER